MNVSAETLRAFQRAGQLQAQGQLAEAERAFTELAQQGEQRQAALLALSDLYLQSGRAQQAVDTLTTLCQESPDDLGYCARLATLLDGFGQADAAIERYRDFLQRNPASADAYFNLALVFKNDFQFKQAEEAYNEALRLGIRGDEEVYLNLGVLYSEMHHTDRARQMYEKAIEIRPEHLPSLFNLAGLYEEQGERRRAIELYRHILSLDPAHSEALSRIAYAAKKTEDREGLVGELTQALARTVDHGQEALNFARGKLLDDLGRYDEAFEAYRAANQLVRKRLPPWNRAAAEQGIDKLMSIFDRSWCEQASTTNDYSPIFVCGMFRSGSTLVEQMLSGHPSVQTAGEFGYITRLIKSWFSPYPERLRDIAAEEIEIVADEYVSKLEEWFPGAENITSKQPDNFLHLGLIKAMFPSARIVYTKRNRLDNCLSVYFTHLGGNLGYASDLGDTAHYYDLQEKLMAHWADLLGDSLFVVDYDDLIADPETVLRGLVGYLGIEWDERCLDFTTAGAPVKTASVWQVREPLYSRSSGRWKNYRKHIADIGGLP